MNKLLIKMYEVFHDVKEIIKIKYYLLYCEHCKKETKHKEVAVDIIGGGWQCMECYKLMDYSKESNIKQVLELDRNKYV